MSNLNLNVLTTKHYRTDYLHQPASHHEITGKGFDIHRVISKLPHPKKGWVLPGYNYLGPLNNLEEQLDEDDNPKEQYLPKNELDNIARLHDICYRDNNNKTGKRDCDKTMLSSMKNMKPKSFREKFDRKLIQGIIGTKHMLRLNINGGELTEKQIKTLDNIYYNPKTGYSSINELQRRSKLKKKMSKNT